MGAADEIIYGRSTFMVEMTQIARILRESDEYSLVVMDEVGRGTAVADGLAIAWAVIKELSMRSISLSPLISTHYPEIAELSADLPVLFWQHKWLRLKRDSHFFTELNKASQISLRFRGGSFSWRTSSCLKRGKQGVSKTKQSGSISKT